MTYAFLKSPAGTEPIIVEGEFKASPARVFRAWTTPDELMQWFGGERLEHASVDLKIGGAWIFRFAAQDRERDVLQGRYVAIEPNRKLVFSWSHTRLREEAVIGQTPESEVTVLFTETESGTRLRVVHQFVGRESARFNIGGGWNASFERMQRLVEGNQTGTAGT